MSKLNHSNGDLVCYMPVDSCRALLKLIRKTCSNRFVVTWYKTNRMTAAGLSPEV